MDVDNPNKKVNKKFLWIILGLIFLVAGGMLTVFIALKDDNKPPEQTATKPSVIYSGNVEGRYMFSGTVVLDRAVEKYANGDLSQPFSGIASFNPQNYDAWMIDLECPVTTNDISFEEQLVYPRFNCNLEWLTELKKNFSLINLANNHSSDLGKDAFLTTQKNLVDAGFQIVGNYDPGVENDRCEVMSLPVKVYEDKEYREAKLPVAFCAFHYFERPPNPGELDIVKDYSEIMPVFSFMHVGVEYVASAGADQRAIARQLIDSGSEFVIGNSPHWVQESEVYKGKPIFYSTGNFMFDQLETETNRGLSIDVSLSVNYDENTFKWLELGESCQEWKDSCLQEAKSKDVSKLKLDLTYEPVGNLTGARVVTTKADAATQKAIEERLNWLQTKQQLGQ
jgi:hypothetical protein